MKTKFLNVDLEIYDLLPEQCARVVAGFGDKVVEIYNGPTEKGYLLSLELASNNSELENVLQEWVELLSKYGSNLKGMEKLTTLLLLRKAQLRLDVGIQAGTEHSTLFCLTPKLLMQLHSCGAELAFTIYGYQEANS